MDLRHITIDRVAQPATDNKASRSVQAELRQAFDEGVLARRQGFQAIACWYPPDSEHRALWLQGHAARPGGQYCVAGQRKHVAAGAFPFAPGAVEAHQAKRPLLHRIGRAIAWTLCVASAVATLGIVIGRLS